MNEMINMTLTTIGRCSLCGGNVCSVMITYTVAGAFPQPRATCAQCGAQEKHNTAWEERPLPTIEMEPKPSEPTPLRLLR